MHRKTVSSTTAALLLVGCASLSSQQDALNTRRPSYSSYEAIPMQSVRPGASLRVKLDDSSPVFSFASGNSYFAAFGLPRGQRRSLQFNISALGWTSFTESTLCPKVQFLNDRNQPAAPFDLYARWVPPGWVTNGYFEGDVDVPADAVSVIIYTGAKEGQRSAPITTFDSGFVYSAGKSTVYVPGSGRGTATMPCASTGEFTLTLQEHQ